MFTRRANLQIQAPHNNTENSLTSSTTSINRKDSTRLACTQACSRPHKSYARNHVYSFFLCPRLSIPLGIGTLAWASVEAGILCWYHSMERFARCQIGTRCY